jgi:inorganic pyrophosphatase
MQSSSSTIHSEVVGTPNSLTWRLNFLRGKTHISPWHDISLTNGSYHNFICEIPKFGKAKFEISTREAFNPMSQDVKKGKLREYHGPIYWNYGCFPQTWEDPSVLHPILNHKGDNDPLDVVEIGSSALTCGSITKVSAIYA